MGLLDKIHTQKSKETSNNNLDKQEIEFILNTIKESNFKGENLDILYKVVVKLQTQYTSL